MKYDLIINGSLAKKSAAFMQKHGMLFPKSSQHDHKGDLWKTKDVVLWEKQGGCLVALYSQIIAAETAVVQEIDETKLLTDSYVLAVKKIRNELLNDVDSIAKATNRLKTETGKMIDSYKSAMDLWTSKEMNQAIENAERLSLALKAVSELKSNNITFTVLDTKKLKV